MTTRLTSDTLRRFARGELSPREEAEIRAALERSPDDRAELALWQALPEAARVPDLDDARWDAIETRVLSTRYVHTNAPSPSRYRVPALALVCLLLLGVSALLWRLFPLLPDPDAPTPSVAPATSKPRYVLPPRVFFDTGRFEATGKTAHIEVLERRGHPDIRVHSLSRKRVQGEDGMITGPDQAVAFRLYGAVRLVLGPDSLLEFREYRDTVAPFLVRGRLAVAVEKPQDPPLTVLSEHARLVDIGTVFSLRSDEVGRGVLAVREGRVRLERPGHDPLEASALTRLLWEGPILPAEQAQGLDGEDPEPLLSLADFPAPAPAPTSLPAQPLAPSPRVEPDSPPPAPVRTPPPLVEPPSPASTSGTPPQEPELTGWQETLDALPLLQRERVGRFFEVVEQQMREGQTVRAIANLENFIENNPGPLGEKARFLLGECHYNLQDWTRARSLFLTYIRRHPNGAWVELAKFRFVELKDR